jgi:hypothetical protein
MELYRSAGSVLYNQTWVLYINMTTLLWGPSKHTIIIHRRIHSIIRHKFFLRYWPYHFFEAYIIKWFRLFSRSAPLQVQLNFKRFYLTAFKKFFIPNSYEFFYITKFKTHYYPVFCSSCSLGIFKRTGPKHDSSNSFESFIHHFN